MNCPEHIVINAGRFMLTMYWRDVPRRLIPLSVWLNPLRYELLFRWPERNRVLKLNPYGRAAYRWANLRHRIRTAITHATGERE